jgi:hypothetical protein
LIEFGRFATRDRKQRGEEKPETFKFLGFTHFCGKRQNGAFIVWRLTTKSRMVAKLRARTERVTAVRVYLCAYREVTVSPQPFFLVAAGVNYAGLPPRIACQQRQR